MSRRPHPDLARFDTSLIRPGMTCREAAIAMGCVASWASKLMRRVGIKPAGRTQRRHPAEDAIVADVKAGVLSYRQIAANHQCEKSTVRYIAMRNDCARDPGRAERVEHYRQAEAAAKTGPWSEAEIVQLSILRAQGKSTRQIALALNRKYNAVVGQAHRLNLEKRPDPIRRNVA